MGNADDTLDMLCDVLRGVPPPAFERLVGRQLGRLLGVPFRLARSGDQRGGDGGVQGPRNLVYEARRYAQETRLDERAIVGQIYQAVARIPDLEAWILVTTQEVSEQIRAAMLDVGRRNGVAALIVDWQLPMPALAALCAFDGEGFEAEIGSGYAELLAEIAERRDYPSALEALRSEICEWSIGYETVREASHRWIREIWGSKRVAHPRFGQMVAGGADGVQHVRRVSVIDQLDAWFASSRTGRLGILTGLEGMGKTWVGLDWLQSRLECLPIVVVLPASEVGDRSITGRDDLIRFVARRLSRYDPETVRDSGYWERRVERILERPVEEGVAFLFYFDGLNQVAGHDWVQTLSQFLDDPFYGRALLLFSARTSFLDGPLARLRGAFEKVDRIVVRPFDLLPGGEFDQRLAAAGLARDDVPDGLLARAAVPRLFDLVVKLRDSLGDVRRVTVHRLLWAYGGVVATDSTSGAFDESRWRRFLLALAEGLREGNVRATEDQVAMMAGDPKSTVDSIHRRTSAVIDSIFAVLNEDGEVDFSEDFVHHALGLALEKRTREAGQNVDIILAEFLDPIEGYDERAEVLRAAVTIALQRKPTGDAAFLGSLCTWWLQTPNLPDDHVDELRVLAPGLVEALLDAVERSSGTAFHRARCAAIEALESVDRDDSKAAKAISTRAAAWYQTLSVEDSGSSRDTTRERILKRIGVYEGRVTIAGHELEIGGKSDPGLHLAAAQLLQGRPLSGATAYFEASAIYGAIRDEPQEEQSWLNVLNAVDPLETAVELRARAAAFTAMAEDPEPDVDPYVYLRVAALLFWRTGYEEDDRSARAVDPRREASRYYETDYLPNPGQSWFTLERRHARDVLGNAALSVRHRIGRAKDALLDPEFDVPQEFVAALVADARRFDFADTSTGRSRTSADFEWEDLSFALARCAPDVLARLERARLRSYSERTGDKRYGAALAAPSLLMLVGSKERSAMATLRKRGSVEDRTGEAFTVDNLLSLEVQGKPPLEQIKTIVDSGIDGVDRTLAAVCGTPSLHDVDVLVADCVADDEKLGLLGAILGVVGNELSDVAFGRFLDLLADGGGDEAAPVWLMLANVAPVRLGKSLNDQEWSWSSTKSYIENVAGSIGVAAASNDVPFVEYAHRIAPSKLLAVLSQEQRSPEEVELAGRMLGRTLNEDLDPPVPTVEVTHDRDQGGAMSNYLCSVGEVVDIEGGNSWVRFFERFGSEHRERRSRLAEQYVAEAKKARNEGAVLYLADIAASDFDAVFRHRPELIETWLEGMDSLTADFVHRIRLSNGFFVALCEALLQRSHRLAVPLWRALRTCLRSVKFKVHGDMDRLVHAIFAAPSCAEVDAALEELYAIDETQSDRDLLDLVVAVREGGRGDWVEAMLAKDSSSPCPAHRRRGSFLQGLVVRPKAAADDQWPGGHVVTVAENVWMLGQREAYAFGWLGSFASARTTEDAHAAWVLFKASADRRAWSWMGDGLREHWQGEYSAPLSEAKRRLMAVESLELKRCMAANEKSWKDNFGGVRYPKSLRPWRSW